jgi:hypothetical protein
MTILAILAASVFAQQTCDVLVYGGTAGGVMSAVAAARMAGSTTARTAGSKRAANSTGSGGSETLVQPVSATKRAPLATYCA